MRFAPGAIRRSQPGENREPPALSRQVDLFSIIADTAACGAFGGAFGAFLGDRRDQMADWLLIGTVLGGAAGVGRALAGLP